MFQRKNPLTLGQKLMSLVWPSIGWRRTGHYIQLRLIRLKGSTRAIASGFAFGASISFVPLPGSHIISAGILSLLTRSNVLASLVGTFIGTPWTFPIMWWAAYKLGDIAFKLFGATIVEMPKDITWEFFVKEISERPMDLMVPWVTGGFIMMLITWPIFYLLAYRMVHKLRHKHNHHAKVQK